MVNVPPWLYKNYIVIVNDLVSSPYIYNGLFRLLEFTQIIYYLLLYPQPVKYLMSSHWLSFLMITLLLDLLYTPLTRKEYGPLTFRRWSHSSFPLLHQSPWLICLPDLYVYLFPIWYILLSWETERRTCSWSVPSVRVGDIDIVNWVLQLLNRLKR